jgi:hypothetical protein
MGPVGIGCTLLGVLLLDAQLASIRLTSTRNTYTPDMKPWRIFFIVWIFLFLREPVCVTTLYAVSLVGCLPWIWGGIASVPAPT